MTLPLNSSRPALASTTFRAFRSLAILVALLAPIACQSTPVAADWQTGVDAFASGDFDAAEAAFRQLAESQPDWYGGHFMLGRVLLEKNQATQALSSLVRAFEAETRPEVALLLARTAVQVDEPSIVLDALAGEPPAQLPAAQQLAWLTLRSRTADSPDARLRDLNAALALAPGNLSVRFAAADAAFEAGRLDEAASHLEAAKGLSPDREAALVRLLKVRLAQSGALPDDAGDDARAAAFVRSGEIAAELAAVTGEANHLTVAGRSYFYANDLERAASYFRQALDVESTWRRAYDLAKVQLDVQEWKAAEERLRPYLEVEGKGRVKMHQLVGRALEGQRRFLEAIPHYEIADDQNGIAHAREGQEVLDEIKEQEQLEEDLKALQDQIGELEDEEAGLR